GPGRRLRRRGAPGARRRCEVGADRRAVEPARRAADAARPMTAGRAGEPAEGIAPAGRVGPGLPEDFGLALDPSTRIVDDGRVLVGGTPPRILRLTAAGGAAVAGWAAG